MADDASSMLGIGSQAIGMAGQAAQDAAKVVEALLAGLAGYKKEYILQSVAGGDSIATMNVPAADKDEFLPILEKNEMPYTIADPAMNAENRPVGFLVLVVRTSDYNKANELLLEDAMSKDPSKYFLDTPTKIDAAFGNKRVTEVSGLSKDEALLVGEELQRREKYFQLIEQEDGRFTIKTLERDEPELCETIKDVKLDLQSGERDVLLHGLERREELNIQLNNIIHGKDHETGLQTIDNRNPEILYDSSNPTFQMTLRKDGYTCSIDDSNFELTQLVVDQHPYFAEILGVERDNNGKVIACKNYPGGISEMSSQDQNYELIVSYVSNVMVQPAIENKDKFKEMTEEEKSHSYDEFQNETLTRHILDERRSRKYKSIELVINDEEPARFESSLLADVSPDVEAEMRTLKAELDSNLEGLTVERYHQVRDISLDLGEGIAQGETVLSQLATEHEDISTSD